MNKDISTLSVEALKALAYDLLVEAERVQKNIQLVNQYIQKKLEEEVKTPTEEPKA